MHGICLLINIQNPSTSNMHNMSSHIPICALGGQLLYPLGGGIKQWCCLTSVCLTFVAYIGPKYKREQRPRKTKIGTKVGHITCDSDTTFKVKGQGHKGRGILWWPPTYSLLQLKMFFVQSQEHTCILASATCMNNEELLLADLAEARSLLSCTPIF